LGKPYNFADPKSILMNGNHGGNIMTATMIGVLDPYGQAVSVLDNTNNRSPAISGSVSSTAGTTGAGYAQLVESDYRYHDTVEETSLVEDTVQWIFKILPGRSVCGPD